jgi:beta-glucosidase
MAAEKDKQSKGSVTRRSALGLGGIGVGVAALGVGNYYANKYAPIISTYLGQKSYEVKETGDGTEDSQYFKPSYANEAERLAADAAEARETAQEGFVLLKNDGTLPLSTGKVTLFGVASASILYGGGGSGAADTSTAPTLKDALESAGFEVNPTMWSFYTEGAASSIRMDVAGIDGSGRYVIHEASPDLFSDTEVQSFSDYADAAIVTLARSGSESSDVPRAYDESYLEPMDKKSYTGSTVHSDPIDSQSDLGRHYLELTTNEEALLAYVAEKFDKVIVLVNSGNAMELSFLDDATYGVDACLWIGNPGQDGLYAVGDILSGVVSPSGRTVDTYAYDSLSAPALQNFGKHIISGSDNAPFVVYQEGIYVGYKYYETRYEDCVLGQGNADASVGAPEGASAWNYADAVQFPFGFGLSYTTFEQCLADHSEKGGVVTLAVEVKNTGSVAGRDVVEVYGQSPYTDYDRENGVEKAAAQLVGFAKTDELEPGASQTVSVEVKISSLKSYDANGRGTYILEGGDYYLAIGDNVHDALNNVLAAKGVAGTDAAGDAEKAVKLSLSETDEYEKSPYTGEQVENQFADVDMRSYDSGFTYLTRSDWKGTYPTTYDFEATDDVLAAMDVKEAEDDPNATMPTTGAQNGLTLAMMREVAADDPAWDDLLDQMTAEEMYNLVRVGGYQTQAVNSVGAPPTVCVDGPAYVGNAGTTGVTVSQKTYAWCSEVVISSTWNVDRAKTMGEQIGEDCLAQGDLNFAGWYAPSMNIHRTPFSGRNFEYYSEDGFMSGRFGAATVAGARSKGVMTFVKHFALNDQETMRSVIATLSNEQAIREIYLAAFEPSVSGGDEGTLGIMLSMNRVGLVWAGDHKGLTTNVVRNEWGFDGVIITDQASYPQAFPLLAIRAGLAGGTDLWLNSGTDNWQIDGYDSNPTVMTQLRQASRHILYAVSRSLAMNGISSTTVVVSSLALWQKALVGVDIAAGAAAAYGVYAIVRNLRKNAAKKRAPVEESEGTEEK